MSSSLIYDPQNLQLNVDGLSEIYLNMARYYEGVENANVSLLHEVFHDTWLMRDNDIPDQAYINVENKDTFIKRVRDHGPYPGYASSREFANAGIAYHTLAFVRINKDPSRNSIVFFLFKLNNTWTITDKIWVNPRDERIRATQVQSNYASIEKLLLDYFEALSVSDADYLNRVLHASWDMKFVDGAGVLQVQSKSGFLSDLNTNYSDYSQLLSIDLYHDTLAIVRIDRPSLSVTSFLVLMNTHGTWQIACERKASSSATTTHPSGL